MSRLSALLNLSAHEETVFKAMGTAAYSVAELTRATSLPRPSVFYVLNQLKTRGLVQRRPHGKRFVWKRVSNHVIRKKLHEAAMELENESHTSPEQQEFMYIHTDADLTVVQGIGALMDVYMHAYTTEKSQRILLTQFPAALKKQATSKRGQRYMEEANRLASNNRGITELIASLQTTKVWEHTVAQKHSLAQEIARRIVDASIVPDEYAPDNLSAELFIFGDTAMLTDWDTETGIVIHNAQIVRMLKVLFHATKDHGHAFNPTTIFLKKLEDAKDIG